MSFRYAADEMNKIARVRSHLALHRYVNRSASPNEITYLKSIGLIPRKGGNKFRSDKHMPKLAKDLSRATSERRTSPREAALAGGITGGVLGSFVSHGVEGLPTKQLLFRRAAPLAALTAAGYAGAQALINKGKDAKTPAKRNAYTAAGQLAGIVAALAPTAIPIGLALGAFRSSQVAKALPKSALPIGKGQVIQFPIGRKTRLKNRTKSILGVAPKKAGEVIPFPTMGKLSHVLDSMKEELEKIAENAGFTVKGGRPMKTSEFAAPVASISRNPITGKIRRSTRKVIVGGHGRPVNVSEEAPAAPPTASQAVLATPEKETDSSE